ncbi:hypothetical protein D4L85_30735 [Chryseolinea soli]|uniref:Uncharacterized protein n=2 Tax=Chryseolinea soli TaxID=2321403 RepID=A0A385SSA6_9BACT|nr:hypothetical protein D4L85_30735 [Chryseolinea soli]
MVALITESIDKGMLLEIRLKSTSRHPPSLYFPNAIEDGDILCTLLQPETSSRKILIRLGEIASLSCLEADTTKLLH